MKSALAHPREFTGRHMLVLMLAFFGVVIGVNIALAVSHQAVGALLVAAVTWGLHSLGRHQGRHI